MQDAYIIYPQIEIPNTYQIHNQRIKKKNLIRNMPPTRYEKTKCSLYKTTIYCRMIIGECIQHCTKDINSFLYFNKKLLLVNTKLLLHHKLNYLFCLLLNVLRNKLSCLQKEGQMIMTGISTKEEMLHVSQYEQELRVNKQ